MTPGLMIIAQLQGSSICCKIHGLGSTSRQVYSDQNTRKYKDVWECNAAIMSKVDRAADCLNAAHQKGINSYGLHNNVGYLEKQFLKTTSVAKWLRAWDTLTMFEAKVCGRS